jgi:hypothetical protein
MRERNEKIKEAWELLENEMELLGVTGVDDKL